MGTLIVALTALASSGVGLYLGAYLRKKAENLATREDLDKLVEQVRAVTTATKEIEARISDEAWNREKMWELKRDVLLEAVKGLGDCFQAFLGLCWAYQADSRLIRAGELGDVDKRVKKLEEWGRASTDFMSSTCFLVSLVGSKDLQAILAEFGRVTRKIAIEVSGGNPEAALERKKDLEFIFGAVSGVLEEELRAGV
ncbi:MAG TPA: hypothetical protein VJY15_16650 [Candidatus Acidoferrum sp.]|nr:hypothetical protein [Candidatus Acidoferrum sp.]